MTDRKSVRRSGIAEDASALGVLLVCCFLFLKGIRTFYPLDLWDESGYLWRGVWPWGTRYPDWGPIYSSVYSFFSHFFHDRIDLFYANLSFEVGAIAILHYLVSRRIGVRPLLSMLGAFFVLISAANAPIIVKINHFNLVCLYTLLFLISFIQSEIAATACFTFLSLGLIYLRQDDALIAAGLLSYLLWLVWHQRSSVVKRATWMGAAVLGFFGLLQGLIIGIGNPFTRGRLWNSFLDLYYWSHVGSGKAITQQVFTRSVFGNASNPFQALLANPKAFLGYVFSNALQFFGSSLPRALTLHFPLTSHTAEKFDSASGWESAILCVLLVAPLLFSFFRRGRTSATSGHYPHLRRIFFVFVAVCFLKSSIFVSLLAPNDRYYFEFLFSFLLLLFALADTGFRTLPRWTLPAVGLSLICLCPNHTNPELFDRFAFYNFSSDPVGKVAYYLRDVPGLHQKKVFSFTAYATYVPEISENHDPLEYASSESLKQRGLDRYLREANPDIFVIDRYVYDTLDRLGAPGDSARLRGYLTQLKLKKVLEVGNFVSVYEK